MHSLVYGFCSSDQRFARGLVVSPHPASFRFHLTMDTLAAGYILPTTGRIRDLHPLETCAARRTLKNRFPHFSAGNGFFLYSMCRVVKPLALAMGSVKSGWPNIRLVCRAVRPVSSLSSSPVAASMTEHGGGGQTVCRPTHSRTLLRFC